MCYILVEDATVVNKLAKGCLSNNASFYYKQTVKNKVLSLHNSVVCMSHAKCKFDCARYTARTLDTLFRQTAFAYITTSTRFCSCQLEVIFVLLKSITQKKISLKIKSVATCHALFCCFVKVTLQVELDARLLQKLHQRCLDHNARQLQDRQFDVQFLRQDVFLQSSLQVVPRHLEHQHP